jgi:biotin operon repressor
MDIATGPGLFGNRTRTRILLAFALLDESHPSELARLLGTTVSNVRKAIDSLEQSGVVVGVLVGRTRRISLNPRYFARDELRVLLDKMALSNAELIALIREMRRRPRLAGKDL